jgi:hypothetical protein
MPEYFDFSIGIILGVVITFAGNYFIEKLKERRTEKDSGESVNYGIEGHKGTPLKL